MTAGILRLEFEGNALFLDVSSQEHRVTKNAIALALPADQKSKVKNGQVVEVLGVFRAGPCGHFGWAVGCIDVETIARIERAPIE